MTVDEQLLWTILKSGRVHHAKMVNVVSLVVAILALVLIILIFAIWVFTGSTPGPVGPQGFQGNQGAAGTLQGAQGFQGNTGNQGSDGNQGSVGIPQGGTTPYGLSIFYSELKDNEASVTTLNGNSEYHFTNYVDNKDVKITVTAGSMRIGQTLTLNFNFSANSNFRIISDNYYILLRSRYEKLNVNISTNPVVTLTYIRDQTIDSQGNPTSGTGTTVPVVVVSTGFPFLRS